MEEIKNLVTPALNDLIQTAKAIYICGECRLEFEHCEPYSKFYLDRAKPICDKCLEKFRQVGEEQERQKRKEFLKTEVRKYVPTLYQEANLKQLPIKFKGIESLYLWSSEPGTGKTHIAWAFYINEFLRGDYQKPLFSTFGGLQLRLRAAMNEKSETEDSIIEDFSNRNFVVLDDLGGLRNGGASDYSLAMVFEILNNRYSWKRQTIITSNKSLSDIAQTFDARIASRLNAMCRIVELTGEDRRLTNG